MVSAVKVLILHASAGAGHQRAAEALSRAFTAAEPGLSVRVCDILDFTPPLFRRTYARGYLDIAADILAYSSATCR
jgi:processive 1,2-diacylglycerol beta-glucosyltransferase